jgi:hypothetical protein
MATVNTDDRRVKVTLQLPLPLFRRLTRHCTSRRGKQAILFPIVEAAILALPENPPLPADQE